MSTESTVDGPPSLPQESYPVTRAGRPDPRAVAVGLTEAEAAMLYAFRDRLLDGAQRSDFEPADYARYRFLEWLIRHPGPRRARRTGARAAVARVDAWFAAGARAEAVWRARLALALAYHTTHAWKSSNPASFVLSRAHRRG